MKEKRHMGGYFVCGVEEDDYDDKEVEKGVRSVHIDLWGRMLGHTAINIAQIKFTTYAERGWTEMR